MKITSTRTLTLLALLFQACGSPHSQPRPSWRSSNTRNLVYGNDDRKDLYQISNRILRSYAPSVGIILNSAFVAGDDDSVQVSYGSYNRATTVTYHKPLCSEVKFRDQLEPGMCSGFLVAPNILATAGHCVEDGIQKLRVIMNFSIPGADLANANSLSVSRSQIYSIKRVIATRDEVAKDASGNYIRDSKQNLEYIDYAFVELDRPVPNATPFKIESTPESKVGDPLLVIGHPEGLPMKYAENARIAADEGIKYFANLDVFHGNSGSMVMNLATHKVIGIYTTTSPIPELTYDVDRNCMKMTQVRDGFSGDRPDEGIVKFAEILKAMAPVEKAEIWENSGGSRTRGSGNICITAPSDLGFEVYYTGTVVENARTARVADGARLEILGTDRIYYKDKGIESLRVRVLSNPMTQGISSEPARPGEILWDYRSLVHCL